MKKLLTLIMILVLSLAGCGSKTDTTKDTTTDTSAKPASIVIFQNKVEISEALSAFAKTYEEETGIHVKVKTAGGSSSYADALMAEFQTDRQPDIFAVGGIGEYYIYKDNIMAFDGTEEWVGNTSLQLTVDNNVVGFPVAVEGWGMGYNKDLLEQAGIDPATLTSQEAYEAAFTILDSMKDELGIKAVISEALSTTTGMQWTTGFHNFNGYLSAGLDYDDRTVIDGTLAGKPDMDRLAEYANWVEMICKYSDQDVLLSGDYDAQVGLWATGQSVFIHQGNWIDPWIDTNQGTLPFEAGYAPHASVGGTMDAIFIGAPSFYVLNKNSSPENIQAAKDFLNYMAMNEKGHDYMVNQAKMVPAFTNVDLVPSSPMSAALAKQVSSGNAYAWWQNDLPGGFCMDIIGPIYESFAKGDITIEQFANAIAASIQDIPNM